MSEEIELPALVMKTTKSEFRLRCHAAAWSSEYGGRMKLKAVRARVSRAAVAQCNGA
jgi:hypothetical protein